jgi:hypothetical protein
MIMLNGWAGFDLGNQMGSLVIARLGEVDFIPHLSLKDKRAASAVVTQVERGVHAGSATAIKRWHAAACPRAEDRLL